MRTGWAAELQGHPNDLEMWRDLLGEAGDPAVMVRQSGGVVQFLLQSSELEAAQDVNDAHAIALRAVRLLNGAIRVVEDTEEVSLGNILRLNADGSLSYHLVLTADVRLRAVISAAHLTAYDAEGQPIRQSPPPIANITRWIAAANRDDDIADLLNHYARSENDWYEIYKMLEIAERIGKANGGYRKLLGAEYSRVKSMRTTANTYRHARGTNSGRVSMSIEDARPLVRWVAKQILDQST